MDDGSSTGTGGGSSVLSRRKLSVHGPAVELDCTVPALEPALELLTHPFLVNGWPQGFQPVVGSLRNYQEAEVLRALSSGARHAHQTPEMMDVFEDGERFWVVDDRWGMAEINMLKGQWRSWVVPQPKLDPLKVAELAVLWPMAQLLRSRGVHLLPAASAVRDGYAVLILCPFGLEPELTAMVASGYKIIGQRWTAVREEDGRLALLHVPGRTERGLAPRLRSTSSTTSNESQDNWIDYADEYPQSMQHHAFCDAVLVAEPGRRPKATCREADAGNAVNVLRRAWPILDLHPTRRASPLPGRLAQSCRTFELQLSRNSKDVLGMLNALRYAPELGDRQTAAA